MAAVKKLALFGAGLVVVFLAAFALADAVVPDSVVSAWSKEQEVNEHEAGHSGAPSSDRGTGAPKGLSLNANGYTLTQVVAPTTVGVPGTLSFQIVDTRGKPLTEYATTHERDMHVIVVRSDGSGFRHVHAQLNEATGVWSVPWTWTAAGTFRLYADFAPADDSPITLSSTIDVAGNVVPYVPQPVAVSDVNGYRVTLGGELTAGSSNTLTLTVEQNGQPVTRLQPYLGAFGHLVALRQGDLAFLHVHPNGTEPTSDELGGPSITFTAEAPTAGRYLLYLDFQIDDTVHTATFVVDADRTVRPEGQPASSSQPEHVTGDHAH